MAESPVGGADRGFLYSELPTSENEKDWRIHLLWLVFKLVSLGHWKHQRQRERQLSAGCDLLSNYLGEIKKSTPRNKQLQDDDINLSKPEYLEQASLQEK